MGKKKDLWMIIRFLAWATDTIYWHGKMAEQQWKGNLTIQALILEILSVMEREFENTGTDFRNIECLLDIQIEMLTN